MANVQQYSPEQAVEKLRQNDVRVSEGKANLQAAKTRVSRMSPTTAGAWSMAASKATGAGG